MDIAQNLKRLRAEKNLSQRRLAELSGVSQQLISQIENNKNATTKELPALAKALNVRVDEIDPNYAFPEATAEDDRLFLEAKALDARSRIQLAQRILASVTDEESPSPSPDPAG